MSEKVDLNIIKYEILTLEHVKVATNLQVKTSMQESLTIGFGLSEMPEGTDREGFQELLKNIIEDGLTIGAFDTTSGELVGVCFNKLHTKSERDCATPLEENVESNMKNPATLDLMRFIFKIESSVDIYDYYGANNALEIFYVGVDARYRRYGIAKNLLDSTIKMAQEIALERHQTQQAPEIVYGVYTSNYSQALARKFDFNWLSTFRYDEYVCWDGVRMSERLGNVHQTAILAARRL